MPRLPKRICVLTMVCQTFQSTDPRKLSVFYHSIFDHQHLPNETFTIRDTDKEIPYVYPQPPATPPSRSAVQEILRLLDQNSRYYLLYLASPDQSPIRELPVASSSRSDAGLCEKLAPFVRPHAVTEGYEY